MYVIRFNDQLSISLYKFLEYGKLRPLCLFCIRLTSDEPSVMFARKQPSDDKQRFDLQCRLRVHPPAALPTEPPPPGLNIHQQCLFDKIHEFCGHQLSRAEPTHPKPQQSTAATVCPSHEVAAAIGTSKNDKRSSDCVVLCQKQTEHMASFSEHFTVDVRFGAEFSKGISLKL